MKYTIFGFSQVQSTKFELNCDDLLLLRWFIDFKESGKMISKLIDGKIYYWVSYKRIAEDCPIVSTKKDTIYRKFKHMAKLGILDKKTVKEGGTFAYYNVGKNYAALLDTPSNNSNTANPLDKSENFSQAQCVSNMISFSQNCAEIPQTNTNSWGDQFDINSNRDEIFSDPTSSGLVSPKLTSSRAFTPEFPSQNQPSSRASSQDSCSDEFDSFQSIKETALKKAYFFLEEQKLAAEQGRTITTRSVPTEADLARIDLEKINLSQIDLPQIDLPQTDFAQTDFAQTETSSNQMEIFPNQMDNFTKQTEISPNETDDFPKQTEISPEQIIHPLDSSITYNKNLRAEDSEEFLLAECLFDNIKRMNPNIKKPNLHRWASVFGYMLNTENRNSDEIMELISWIYRDDNFWSCRILTADNFKNKYDRLIAIKNFEQKQARSKQRSGHNCANSANGFGDSNPNIFKTQYGSYDLSGFECVGY